MISKINKKVFLGSIDVMLVFLSYFLIVLLAREVDYIDYFLSYKTMKSIAMTSVVFVLSMAVVGFYSYLWIYTGAKDYFFSLLSCFCACIITGVISLLSRGVFLNFKYVLASGLVASVLIIGLRIAFKIAYLFLKEHYTQTSKKLSNLLIIGAGSAAALALRSLNTEYADKYSVVGMIDDDTKKIGCRVYGVKVLGSRENIKEICKKMNVKEILFAIPSIKDSARFEILNICSETGCKVRILPQTTVIFDKIEIGKDTRDIQLEDLLQRDVIELDKGKISEYIKGNIALVTGGGGSIGSELCRQIAGYNPEKLIIVDIYENNAYDIQNELRSNFPELDMEVLIASVRDLNRLEKIFEKYKPDVVFHAAAHKHVPLMEDSSGEAIKNNVYGTLNCCICADKYKVKKFVLISTDKAVNPTNIMGASKRMCEMIIQGINKKSETEYVAVRFGNVLGSNGSVVPLFKKQIEKGGPVTVTHKDITRYFMLIPEAAQLVLEAATFAKGGEIFVLDMGEPVKIYDLALKMIKLSGYEIGRDINIEITGLRPGEKLYEELLMSEEGLTSTRNKKIFIAKPTDIDYDKLIKDIEELMNLAKAENNAELRNVMKQIVPTFKEEVLS